MVRRRTVHPLVTSSQTTSSLTGLRLFGDPYLSFLEQEALENPASSTLYSQDHPSLLRDFSIPQFPCLLWTLIRLHRLRSSVPTGRGPPSGPPNAVAPPGP